MFFEIVFLNIEPMFPKKDFWHCGYVKHKIYIITFCGGEISSLTNTIFIYSIKQGSW